VKKKNLKNGDLSDIEKEINSGTEEKERERERERERVR
jgi:hypothetical protein